MKLRLAKKLFKQRSYLRRTTRDKMINRLWKYVKKDVFKHAMTLPVAPIPIAVALRYASVNSFVRIPIV